MNYLIDYDTRTVLCKSENKKELVKYIIHNELSSAVALIANADDLEEQLSLKELSELYENLTFNEAHHDEDESFFAAYIWKELKDTNEEIPTYTEKLGEKLLDEVKTEKPLKRGKKEVKPKTGRRRKEVEPRKNVVYRIGKQTPKRLASKIKKVLDCIEENWGEATEKDLFEALSTESGKPLSTLNSYVKNDFIMMVEE
jgi:hypothetical protein